MRAIDSHIHCGIQDPYPPQHINAYLNAVGKAPIVGAVAFPPVMEVYDRYDSSFYDSDEWRRKRNDAHDYLLALASGMKNFRVIPFLFMWNDFAFERLDEGFRGVKWHRHPEEPMYDYKNPRCALAIDAIRCRDIPVVLEEEFHNTIRFIRDYARGVKVIIPHCGLLNGGYERVKAEGLWELPNVYADSALAPVSVIEDFLTTYGHEKLLFGSDFPFGDPQAELDKVMNLPLDDNAKEAVIKGNIIKLTGFTEDNFR
ncbi:MAG TPA: metal-dependent hydrolase [Thermodesulforhabdus norvegica]|uniref:Metal-dependent hydrolase n=1 Tax=Thermodesulforhabdus norvegica TaxID=39841 RepID=A0A7C1AYV9_9BACT|nr:amidohydrolase family protein [Deltaproteobacteria bacterium]MBW2067421.1 amidohydrolase family protein [Deltaproteobacteria bacterium]HDL90362.1 metal-dependent hydrolase [Thermodesulforhabdus norvegica]